jgi:hypothetical protein
VTAGGRSGGTFGNVLLVMATLALLAAVMYPAARARGFEERVEAIVSDIELVRSTVDDIREETGTWPPSAAIGELVPGLLPPGEAVGNSSGRGLEWRRLESVEVPPPSEGLARSVPEDADEPGQEVPVPDPTFFHRGAISLHSSDEEIMGALLDRFPGSFVHDGVWTLLLRRVTAPATP